MRALYEMSRDLSGALMPEQIAEIASALPQPDSSARAAMLLADDNDRLQPAGAVAGDADGHRHRHRPMGVRSWRRGRLRHRHAAGQRRCFTCR